MKLLYFAWLRTKIGISSEEVTPPDEVTDVGGLIDWLASRGPGYADAWPTAIRCAWRSTGLCRPRPSGVPERRGRPVSAGHRRVTVRVQSEDFDLAAEIDALTKGNHGIGGIASFMGVVREWPATGPSRP